MPITEKQRERRRQHIGSSDMAAILGVPCHGRNAWTVWADKTGRAKPVPENAAMQAGTMFEQGVLQWAQEQLGPMRRGVRRVCPGTPLAANVDAIVNSTGNPVEAKTAGLFGPLSDDWGDEGTSEVPAMYVVQAHVHMMCTDRFLCHLAAFLAGRGFVMYEIPRNEELVKIILDKQHEFWANHVLTDTPPPDTMPSLDVAKRLVREPNKTVEIDRQLIDQWLAAKEFEKIAADKRKESEAVLLASLDDAECGDAGDAGTVTYYQTTRKGYEVKPSVYRQLRHKKPKTEELTYDGVSEDSRKLDCR